jgi:hypothetical protein
MLNYWITSRLRTAVLLIVATMIVTAVAEGTDDSRLLSKVELKSLIANAKTAVDHERLAAHFDAKGAQLEAEARDHDELAQEYKRTPPVSRRVEKSQSYEHCRELAKDYANAAQDARRLAADHRALAKEASAR